MNVKKNKLERYLTLIITMLILFSILLWRAYSLQILDGAYYASQVNNGTITSISQIAPRGNILDKNGIVLAGNKNIYTLEYTQTKENDKTFYDSISIAFNILENSKEPEIDNFQLKVNPLRFDFASSDPTIVKDMEIKFKRDRGMNSAIEAKLFPKVKSSDLTAKEKDQVNEALLKITPLETFQYLARKYTMLDLIKDKSYTTKDINSFSNSEYLNLLLNNITLVELRKYMNIKDELSISGPSKPVLIESNINKDTAFTIEQRQDEMPGISIDLQPVRYYPNNDLGSAFLGYLSKISENSQDSYQEKGYDVTSDYIGAGGIEAAFETRLKGPKGENIVKLNPQGKVIETLGTRDPYPGENVQLSIDKDVQYAAEKSLTAVMQSLRDSPDNGDVNTTNANRGAAVAIDVNTGKVIALASLPGFNPNDFSGAEGISSDLQKKYFSPDLSAFGLKYINDNGLASKNNTTASDMLNKLFPINSKTKLRQDPYDIYPKPLFNYATNSLVPPGSAFKPMVAIAGLESGVITPNTTVDDNGAFNDGNGFKTTFPSDGPNGVVNLKKALEKSSNPFFMTVGKLLRDKYGDDILAKYAWQFGLGVNPSSKTTPSTGIEIPESFGQVFNTVSIKNSFANSYLSVTMDSLLSGKSYQGGYFKTIDLYYRDGDSDELKNIKKEIKDNIQQGIKTGSGSVKGYTALLNELIAKDPRYTGKNLNKTDIELAAEEIINTTVYDAYTQTNIGTNMYNASIGQGLDAFTPLQLANYIATLVNGGTRYKLSLVDKITDVSGATIKKYDPEIIDKVAINPANVAAIESGMRAVTGSDGTAAAAFKNFPIDTAGKTGSATFRQDQATMGRTAYAVYVGYAPSDKPQIAICVIVFDGGHGGLIAPVARAMYEAYFKNQLKSSNYTPSTEDSFLLDMFKNTSPSTSTGN